MIDAIILDVREPEPWEAIYIAHALNALAEGRFEAAKTFAQRAQLIKPGAERPAMSFRFSENLRLIDIEFALGVLKARVAPYPDWGHRSRSPVWTAIEKSRRGGRTADLWVETEFL